jgi:integrase
VARYDYLERVTRAPLPHLFRWIFATEAVSGRLPVRIGAKLLGHRDRAGNSVRVVTPGPRRQRGP